MKAKFKISQLAAVDTVTKELVHPKHGDTGINFTLAGPSHPTWREALKVFRESAQDEDANMALLAATVIGWDEEAMEAPYSPEAVLAAFKKPENEWMTLFVSNTVLDNTTFFL